jgi:hypothetical protein
MLSRAIIAVVLLLLGLALVFGPKFKRLNRRGTYTSLRGIQWIFGILAIIAAIVEICHPL